MRIRASMFISAMLVAVPLLVQAQDAGQSAAPAGQAATQSEQPCHPHAANKMGGAPHAAPKAGGGAKRAAGAPKAPRAASNAGAHAGGAARAANAGGC